MNVNLNEDYYVGPTGLSFQIFNSGECWYWWPRAKGFEPSSQSHGPFFSKRAAYDDAMAGGLKSKIDQAKRFSSHDVAIQLIKDLREWDVTMGGYDGDIWKRVKRFVDAARFLEGLSAAQER